MNAGRHSPAGPVGYDYRDFCPCHVSDMPRPSLFKEFFLFIRQEKKYWLVPLILVLLVVGALIVLSTTSPLAPFLYPLF
jgi:hypothetical protein